VTLLNTPQKLLRDRWKQGFKTGMKKREAEILQILEFYQMIWWDEAQQVWLNINTGKPVYGLDWRENANYLNSIGR
jgi:hypothetical protein